MGSKKRVITLAAVIAIFAGIWIYPGDSKESCINLYIDFGQLDNSNKISQCIPATKTTAAFDILKSGKIDLEGTNKYGLQVVCRVNGLPTKEVEPCDIMPAEEAFWAIITKEKLSLVNLFPKWGWAQVGVADIKLNPGDSFGLVFSQGGDLKWPD